MTADEFQRMKGKKAKPNTNNLTKSIVSWLNYNGFVAWRNNNNSVYSVKQQVFRKNPLQKLGVFDIIGFRKSDGKHIEIEIKTGRDRISDSQINHLNELCLNNCIGFVVNDFDGFIFCIRNYLK